MKNRVLYLAEPIDQSGGVRGEHVNRLIQVATKMGWLVYRPSTAWWVQPGELVGPEIERFNRMTLAESGAMVAVLPPELRTIGVPREIEWCKLNGVPVAAMTSSPGWSLHDVPAFELDDVPGVGGWLQSVERSAVETVGEVSFLLETGATLPTRANPGDAGYDLYTFKDTTIFPGEFEDVPVGCKVALPPGTWGRITGRSSTLRKRQLLVAEGVLDTGYRGPLYAGVWNLGDAPANVQAGDRIAQMVLHDNVSARFRAVSISARAFDRIPGDGRGEDGFGSTGF